MYWLRNGEGMNMMAVRVDRRFIAQKGVRPMQRQRQRQIVGVIVRYVRCLLTASSWLFGSAQAQSLQALYQAAQGFDAPFLAAQLQAQATQAHAAQARADILPTVGIGAGVSQTNQSSSFVSYDAHNFDTQYAAISATQPLYRPANWAHYAQGARQSELALVQLQAAQQDLMLRVSQAYFDVLAAADTLALEQAQKAAIHAQMESARRNFDVGTATIVDTRDAQARYDLAVAQEIAADNDLRVKSLALEQLVGMPGCKPLPLRSAAHPASALAGGDDTPLQTWVELSQTQSPEIHQSDIALAVAQLETRKAEAAAGPTLDLVGSYASTNNINGNAMLPNSFGLNQATIGVVFNLPLYAGNAIQNQLKETLALEEKARTDLQGSQRRVAQATRSAYYGLQTARAQVTAYEAAQQSSQSALDANQLGYQVGVKINIDVLNAQSQLFDTLAHLAHARYDVLLGALRLRQASGVLRDSDITALSVLTQD